MNVDLIVIGAGPAGQGLARTLRGSGLRRCVLEQRPLSALQNPTFGARDIALTPHRARLMRLIRQARQARQPRLVQADHALAMVGLGARCTPCKRAVAASLTGLH